MKYVKKPVVIDAMQYVNETDLTELKNWVETFDVEWRTYFNADANSNELSINTLEGTMKVSKGDYIIRGIKGEFYACKPDVFDMTYDKILGENLPEIYNQFPKLNIENIPLADRIAGKIDENGNPVKIEDLMKKWMPEEKKEEIVPNDFLSRRIAGEIDELGNPVETENTIINDAETYQVGDVVEVVNEKIEVEKTDVVAPKENKKKQPKKKNKK
jgi:hypothetical protein